MQWGVQKVSLRGNGTFLLRGGLVFRGFQNQEGGWWSIWNLGTHPTQFFISYVIWFFSSICCRSYVLVQKNVANSELNLCVKLALRLLMNVEIVICPKKLGGPDKNFLYSGASCLGGLLKFCQTSGIEPSGVFQKLGKLTTSLLDTRGKLVGLCIQSSSLYFI